MGVDDGLFAGSALEVIQVLWIVHEEVLCEVCDDACGDFAVVGCFEEFAVGAAFAGGVKGDNTIGLLEGKKYVEAEQTLTVTTTGFTPAGPENVSAPDSYTLVADGKDNAYLYGTFAEGGSVTVKKGDAELASHTFNVTSEHGKSYALYAGKK